MWLFCRQTFPQKSLRGPHNLGYPKIVSLGFYTANMGGVDRADQFRSYCTIVRQSRKRYRYIFWFPFNVAACNRYILECEYLRIRNLRKRPQAPLELGKRLIDGYAATQVPALETTKRFEKQAERNNVYSANLLVEKHRKASQLEWETSANSVVLRYAKCGTLPIIIVKTHEHTNRFYNS